jgi:hypothetical protein
MHVERHAQRRYILDEPGFYVVNPKTDIAVAGPYDEAEQARGDANRRNATLPAAPDPLVVVQLAQGRGARVMRWGDADHVRVYGGAIL